MLKIIKGEALLTIGYANFSHVTIAFIAKYLFTGSVKILDKIVFKINKIYFNEKSWNLLLFIFWKIQINSNENSKRKLIISTQSAMCSTSFVSVYWSWNTHMCQIVCNPAMNLLHLHAIRDSKTWNGSDKTSMTTGNYKTFPDERLVFSFYGKQLCLKNLDCI
jgi:uncharacterized membrane protein